MHIVTLVHGRARDSESVPSHPCVDPIDGTHQRVGSDAVAGIPQRRLGASAIGLDVEQHDARLDIPEAWLVERVDHGDRGAGQYGQDRAHRPPSAVRLWKHTRRQAFSPTSNGIHVGGGRVDRRKDARPGERVVETDRDRIEHGSIRRSTRTRRRWPTSLAAIREYSCRDFSNLCHERNFSVRKLLSWSKIAGGEGRRSHCRLTDQGFDEDVRRCA